MGFRSGKMSPQISQKMETKTIFAKDDKWKLASQLQKSIRHGLVETAIQAARDLYEVEPAYLRYRISVIAVEDVGAGSPSVVIEAFDQGWKKNDIAKRGGLEFLEKTVADFAKSVKDRTPCDLMYCTRFVQDFETRYQPWSELSWENACRIALDEKQQWWARALAAWRCAGTDKFQARTEILPTVTGNWDKWVSVNAEAFGEQAALLMKVGENQREHHHVFMGLALAAQKHSGSIVTPVLPSLPNIGPWISAALDKHTSEGRRALSLLPTMYPQSSQMLKDAGISLENQPDLIGRMWFWMEGSRCDKEKGHDMARQIRNDNQSRVLGSISPSLLIKAFGDPQMWQHARQAAVKMNNTYRYAR